MRVLGLDYGRARCGCALSDPTGTIVTPIDTIRRPLSRRGMSALKALVSARDVERVIVGLPLSLRGGDTMQTQETRVFVQRLSRELGESVPVEMYDERFTTRMAQRIESPSTGEDSRAAAHMLEGWLTAWNRERSSASSR
jgi:putative holliday junction resolvase